MTKTQHREMQKKFDEGVSAGGVPAKVWRSLMSRQVPHAVLAIMLEIERHRLALGLSGETLAERAGVAERAYPKWLRPWARGGRIPSEKTLMFLVEALSVKLRRPAAPLSIGEYQRKLENLAVRHQRQTRSGNREHIRRRMRELSPRGVEARNSKIPAQERSRVASLGGKALAHKMTPEQRAAKARAMASVRWSKVSQVDAPGATPDLRLASIP
jgi:transcriptional regulator with XRE-family HTH domain